VARTLIVNADDGNLTAGVSRGIFQAHREGIVTGTTILVNLPGLALCRELAAGAPGLDLGLHVNLTLGPPVLPPARVASLIDAAGRFPREPGRFAHGGNEAEIAAELGAQLERFLEVFGRPPTHLDSHHHVHRHPRILEPMIRMALGLGVPLRPAPPLQPAALRARGLAAVDRTAGDITEEALRDPRRLAAFLAGLPDGATELICHPGYPDEGLAVSSYAAPRAEELRALCDPLVREAMDAAAIRCAGFRELPSLPGART